MLLAITTTRTPATDLGYLLHKNPRNVHAREQSFGKAYVFYPEAGPSRCTAVLYVEVDPIGLVRDRRGFASQGLIDQYVNDRPYAASSLLCAAISDAYGSALNGRCADRPELVHEAFPLEVDLPVLPCRGGEEMLRELFEPLGYAVMAQQLPLDAHFPTWGESSYYRVRLMTSATLQNVLSHLYVLIPVLDNAKHYWVGEDEVDKLLKKGEGWLPAHPARDLIVRRYLKHKRSLADLALARLIEADGSSTDEEESSAGEIEVRRGDEREQTLERRISLNEQRLSTVAGAIVDLGASSVIDLGCGEGKLLKLLLSMREVRKVTGVDVSHRALELARDRLNVERLPKNLAEKLSLLHGALTYRDKRFQGFDVATVVEVVEHLDEPRLDAFTRVLFEHARPSHVIMTTPNREYNVRFEGLPTNAMRHADHRFEWTRDEFEQWIDAQCKRFGYGATFQPIGEVDSEVGPPTQMAVLSLAA